MAVVLRRRGVALIACTLLAQLLGHGQGQQPAAQPVWAGTTAEHLFAEYGTIFGANGNRNAASHLWSTFLIDRTWQMPEPQVLELFRSFCPVSGSPVRPADRNRYQVGVPAGADGGLRHGITHFCCAPCVCDTLEFINMDTKTIATADGPREYWFAVIGNPCERAGVLDTPFVSPFDGVTYTLAQRAPSLSCNGTDLAGATLSDSGNIIIGMIQDSSTSKTEQAAAMSGVQYHDAESFDAYCSQRAANNYASGMGEIFRKVAEVTPARFSTGSPAITAAASGNATAAPAVTALPVGTISASISLAKDVESVSDPDAYLVFVTQFEGGVAAALGVAASRVTVTDVRSGSMLVDFIVAPPTASGGGSEPVVTAAELVASLPADIELGGATVLQSVTIVRVAEETADTSTTADASPVGSLTLGAGLEVDTTMNTQHLAPPPPPVRVGAASSATAYMAVLVVMLVVVVAAGAPIE